MSKSKFTGGHKHQKRRWNRQRAGERVRAGEVAELQAAADWVGGLVQGGTKSHWQKRDARGHWRIRRLIRAQTDWDLWERQHRLSLCSGESELKGGGAVVGRSPNYMGQIDAALEAERVRAAECAALDADPVVRLSRMADALAEFAARGAAGKFGQVSDTSKVEAKLAARAFILEQAAFWQASMRARGADGLFEGASLGFLAAFIRRIKYGAARAARASIQGDLVGGQTGQWDGLRKLRKGEGSIGAVLEGQEGEGLCGLATPSTARFFDELLRAAWAGDGDGSASVAGPSRGPVRDWSGLHDRIADGVSRKIAAVWVESSMAADKRRAAVSALGSQARIRTVGHKLHTVFHLLSEGDSLEVACESVGWVWDSSEGRCRTLTRHLDSILRG